METKVQKNTNQTIPQWLLHGVEAYTYNDQKYLMINGSRVLFHEAPEIYQQFFVNGFVDDKKSQNDLKQFWGITSFEEGFEKWFHCKFGGLDSISDSKNLKELIPDTYNNTCTDTKCTRRGEFCGTSSHLTTWDAQTLQVLSVGTPIRQAANVLCLSIAGVKSRINAIRNKTGARNMAELMTMSAHIGAI